MSDVNWVMYNIWYIYPCWMGSAASCRRFQLIVITTHLVMWSFLQKLRILSNSITTWRLSFYTVVRAKSIRRFHFRLIFWLYWIIWLIDWSAIRKKFNFLPKLKFSNCLFCRNNSYLQWYNKERNNKSSYLRSWNQQMFAW